MTTFAQKAEPNDALGLLLIALIVSFTAVGVYYCSVNSYKWGPAVIVPPQYEGINSGVSRQGILPGHLPDGR
jgi:hypothetical protein